MSLLRCTGLAVTTVLLVLAPAPRVFAAPRTAPLAHVEHGATVEGRRHFRDGERLFQVGRYGDAAAAYERGYRLTHLPGFLINMAHCHVRLGVLTEARRLYRAFLEEAPASPRRAEVERAVAALDERLAPPVPPSLPPEAPSSPRDRAHRLELAWMPLRTSDAPRTPMLLERAPVPPAPEHGWLWPALGGLVAGLVVGAAVMLLVRGHGDQSVKDGTIGTLTR